MAQNIPVVRELPIQPYRPLPITQNIPVNRQLPVLPRQASNTVSQSGGSAPWWDRLLHSVGHGLGAAYNWNPQWAQAIAAHSDPIEAVGATRGKGYAQGKGLATPQVAPTDKGLALLESLGIHGQEANTLLAQINRAGQIAKLPTEFQGPVQSYFDAQDAKQKQQPFVDPLTMQMFFGSQIAPYIQKFAANTQQQVGQGYDTLMANLPRDKFTSSLLRDLIPQEKAAAVGEAQANANAIGPAAQLNAIMQQLAQSQQTQLAMNADLRNQATLGLLGGQAGAFSAPATK